MILQCPNCGSKFRVNSAMVPPEGVEVRCSQCQHEWHAQAEERSGVFDVMAMEPARPTPRPEPRPEPRLPPANAYMGSEMDGFPIDGDDEDNSPLPQVQDNRSPAQPVTSFNDIFKESEPASPARMDDYDSGFVELIAVDREEEEESPAVYDEPTRRDDESDASAFGEEGEAEAEMTDEERHVKEIDQAVLDKLMEYDIPSQVQLVKDKKPRKLWPALVGLAAALLVACVGSLYGFRSQLQTTLPGVYAMLGMPRTDGLVLADVMLRKKPSKDKARFIVEGRIVNQSGEVRRVPILRVSVRDANNEVIISREYDADTMLQPDESFPFKATKLDTSFIDRVDHLVVDLGNGIELMLRE